MIDRIDIRLNLNRGEFQLAADLQLPGHGVSALFGPSGSGKTTLLRTVAGLERVPDAVVRVNGEVWQNGAYFKPVHERALGYVFQEASLFAHLSVRSNLEYGQKRIPATQRRIKLDHAVELLGIGHLLERRPDTLSGGERQRVAIARALLTSPQLLLMDEPLAALDARRKAEILPYLERLHGELDMPVLYVSHSPEEVARLADHLVLLDGGNVVTSGPLAETLARLDLPGFFQESAGVVINTTIAAHDEADHLSLLAFAGGEIWVNQRNFPVGQAMRCRIDSRDVSITLQHETGTSILNILPATITGLADTDHPARVLVQLDVGGTPLLARITRRSAGNLALAPGKSVWAQIKAVALLDS